MRRKSAMLVGNGLMGAVMILMVPSIAVSVLNQLPQITMPALMADGGIMGIYGSRASAWVVTRKFQTATGGIAALTRAAGKNKTPATINLRPSSRDRLG